MERVDPPLTESVKMTANTQEQQDLVTITVRYSPVITHFEMNLEEEEQSEADQLPTVSGPWLGSPKVSSVAPKEDSLLD